MKYYIHENDLVKDHVHNFVVIEKKKKNIHHGFFERVIFVVTRR